MTRKKRKAKKTYKVKKTKSPKVRAKRKTSYKSRVRGRDY